jgi:hypothetical protein
MSKPSNRRMLMPLQKRPGTPVEKFGSRWDESYFPHDSRHFVPGYYRAVPPGQKPSADRSASHYPILALTGLTLAKLS